jgi:hypothetical protein
MRRRVINAALKDNSHASLYTEQGCRSVSLHSMLYFKRTKRTSMHMINIVNTDRVPNVLACSEAKVGLLAGACLSLILSVCDIS